MEVEREIGADDIRRQLHNEHILQMEEEAKRILNPLAPPAQPPVTTASVQPPAGLETRPVVEPAATPAASSEPPQPPRAP
ncbi:sec-independent translocase [compost metagenome]